MRWGTRTRIRGEEAFATQTRAGEAGSREDPGPTCSTWVNDSFPPLLDRAIGQLGPFDHILSPTRRPISALEDIHHPPTSHAARYLRVHVADQKHSKRAIKDRRPSLLRALTFRNNAEVQAAVVASEPHGTQVRLSDMAGGFHGSVDRWLARGGVSRQAAAWCRAIVGL